MEWPGWLVAAWESSKPFAERAALWRGYEQDLQTLLIYGAGIAIFTMLVFAFFCQNLSRRDAFLSKDGKSARARILRGSELAIVFPAMSFLFFGLLAASLFLLAKSQTTTQILLLSMSLVVGVRVTAFVSENAAADLAKLLPLSLLGVLIVDPSYASLDKTWAHFGQLPALLPLIGRFFLLFIALEGALRLARGVVTRVMKAQPARRPKKSELIANAAHTTPVKTVPVKTGPVELTREP